MRVKVGRGNLVCVMSVCASKGISVGEGVRVGVRVTVGVIEGVSEAVALGAVEVGKGPSNTCAVNAIAVRVLFALLWASTGVLRTAIL